MKTSYAQLGRAAFLVLIAAGGLAAVRAPRDRSPGPVVQPEAGVPESGSEGLPGGAMSLVGQDPFREDRRPTSPRYRPFAPDEGRDPGPAQEPSVPRPAWTLTGVFWGTQPLALFEGVPPELSSGILGQGEAVGPITVARIAPDTVYLEGAGATWAFTIETPWKAGGNP